MSSLTFVRPPPLVPASSLAHAGTGEPGNISQKVKNDVPGPLLSLASSTSASASDLPTTAITGHAPHDVHSSTAVPPSMVQLETKGTPDAEVATQSPRAPASAAHGIIPSSLSTPLGGMRPINPISAMRGRGIGIGSRIPPIREGGRGGERGEGVPGQIHKGEVQPLPHAFTPGNTPSSLERISRRIANNLMLVPAHGKADAEAEGGINKIAPSYERRFNAGLSDLDHRLKAHAHAHAESGLRSPPQTMTASASGGKVPFLGDSATRDKTDWPSDFGSASE